MSVTLRKMTPGEFDFFYQWSAQQQARELMEELGLSPEEAHKTASKEIAEMLPDGLYTEHNNLMTVVADGENAGFIWTLYEESDGQKQAFVCDFAIWETKRRKGYGAAALSLTEKNAAKTGCQKSVLFVREDNTAAKALYKKCGYQPLRQKGYGIFMVKPLTPAL